MITYILPPKETVRNRYQTNHQINNYFANRSKKIKEQLRHFTPKIISCEDSNLSELTSYILIVEDELDIIEDLLKAICKSEKVKTVIIADNLVTIKHLLNDNCVSPQIVTLDLFYGVTNPMHKNKLTESVSIYQAIKDKWANTLVIVLTQNPSDIDVLNFSKTVTGNNDYFLGKDKGMVQVFDIIDANLKIS